MGLVGVVKSLFKQTSYTLQNPSVIHTCFQQLLKCCVVCTLHCIVLLNCIYCLIIVIYNYLTI